MKWSEVEVEYVRVQATPSSRVKNLGPSTSTTKCFASSTADVRKLRHLSTKVFAPICSLYHFASALIATAVGQMTALSSELCSRLTSTFGHCAWLCDVADGSHVRLLLHCAADTFQLSVRGCNHCSLACSVVTKVCRALFSRWSYYFPARMKARLVTRKLLPCFLVECYDWLMMR